MIYYLGLLGFLLEAIDSQGRMRLRLKLYSLSAVVYAGSHGLTRPPSNTRDVLVSCGLPR